MRYLSSLGFRWFVFIGLSVFALGASADCGGDINSGTCSSVRVTLLYIDANTDAYIAVSGNVNALACAPYGNLIVLPRSSANFKEVYATLLAAQMSDRTVNVRLTPGAAQCTVAYVTVPS